MNLSLIFVLEKWLWTNHNGLNPNLYGFYRERERERERDVGNKKMDKMDLHYSN